MNLLNKLITILLLIGFYAPSYAAVDGVELTTCSVFSDDEKEDEKKGEEEEEPDCD
ncbi:MAG: hypothetical protein QNL62_15085 [Gammaproteobacteria bacterium]|nr:hypothetical protein [Gammaproteobacteria bacterium]